MHFVIWLHKKKERKKLFAHFEPFSNLLYGYFPIFADFISLLIMLSSQNNYIKEPFVHVMAIEGNF